MLVSKNSGRFRIQSSSFEGLWLLADEVVRRLVAYHTQPSQRAQGGDAEEPFAVLYAEPLPLQVSWRPDRARDGTQSDHAPTTISPRADHNQP